MADQPADISVPFLDLKAGYIELKEEIDEAVRGVLEGGWYILGPTVERFESEFAEYVGAKHCIGVANGLEALMLGVHALGVRPGDEVIVPANTYIATWLAVSHVRATVVPVEPDPTTMNLDAGSVEAAMTERTKVVLPVHLYGLAADMEGLETLCAERGVALFADGAQAHGARIGGRPVGEFGDAAAWSFYPSKNLGAFGDGGAVTCDDDELADQLRLLRNYGSRKKYVNEIEGVNSRLDPIQAAALSVKLRHLDAWNERRREIAARYAQGLADLEWLTLPTCPQGFEHVWHVYAARTAHRESLMAHMADAKVGALIHYPIAPHQQDAYAELGLTDDDLPLTAEIHRTIVSLPMGPQLKEADVARVIDVVRGFDPGKA